MEYTGTNKLIAEFMGGEYDATKLFYKIPGINGGRYIGNLKYHTSWDWLVPVVEKIESMGFKFQMCRRRVDILHDSSGAHISFNIKEETKINSVYTGVLHFIKWHTNDYLQPSITY